MSSCVNSCVGGPGMKEHSTPFLMSKDAVYTFPAYRHQRIAGKLLHELAEIARQNGENRVYIATDHANVYEKYGCTYLDSRSDIDGEISRIYTLNA